MPNHITSRLTIHGRPEQVDNIIETFGTNVKAHLQKSYDDDIICHEIFNEHSGKVGWFNIKNGEFTRRDEETVIGLPDGWEFSMSESFVVFPDFKKIIPPPNDDAYNDLPDQKTAEKSPNWWFKWNTANWGTKWNSYSHEKISWNVFEFQTAWNGVPELIRIMSEKTPDVVFEYIYADEDSGSNTGSYTFLNGVIQRELVPESQSLQGYEIYFELNEHQREDYEVVNGKYQYKEE